MAFRITITNLETKEISTIDPETYMLVYRNGNSPSLSAGWGGELSQQVVNTLKDLHFLTPMLLDDALNRHFLRSQERLDAAKA